MLPLRDQTTARVRLSTRFGDFEIDPRDIVSFPAGLPGFEGCRRFVVLSSDAMAPLQCLHAVEGEASFLAVDPRLILPTFRCDLSGSDCRRIGADGGTVLLWLALVTTTGEHEASLNLRAPVVINPARMIGFQVVPQDTLYPLRYPLPLG